MKIRKLKRKKSGSVTSVPSEPGWNRFAEPVPEPLCRLDPGQAVAEEDEHEPDAA